MILTITMNPSIDFTYMLDAFRTGMLNRTNSPTRSIGGKGINAGRAAALSGSEVILTGFLGGKMGHLTKEFLEEENLFHIEMIEIGQESRTAITIMHDNNTHTEIVEKGPFIEADEIHELLATIKKIYSEKSLNVICICGSVNSESNHVFQKIIEYIRENISMDIPIVVDISGDELIHLMNSKGYKPDFIKPNEHELADFIGSKVVTKNDALSALKDPRFSDIPNVIASLGENGAVCKIKQDYYFVDIPKITIASTTGSGDATVGGFAHALEMKFDTIKAIKYAMACGMSNAQHEGTGMVDSEAIPAFMEQIQVMKVTS